MNPKPSWHKLTWMAAFVREIPNYRHNTVETVRLAIRAREALFGMARAGGIDFNLKTRGILHFYRDRASFEKAARVSWFDPAVAGDPARGDRVVAAAA